MVVNFSDSMQEMTQSLYIYDELLSLKRKEKLDLLNQIKFAKLDIKHTQVTGFKVKAVEADMFRETKKIKKQVKTKVSQAYFFNKEIIEIKACIPEVSTFCTNHNKFLLIHMFECS